MNMHAKLDPADATPAYPPVRDFAPEPARRRWLKPVLALLVIAVLAAVAYAVFGGGKTAVPPVAPELPKVTVIVPGSVAVADSVRAAGSIAARRDAPVGVQGEGGTVTAVLVDAGQFVKAGQVLARIDRSVQVQQVASLAAGIREARANAALAQSELTRAQTLVAKGFVSKADIDRKTATLDGNRARVGVAEAQLAEMQARVAKLDIRAPASGLVLARNVEAGQVVGPGSAALFRIAEGGTLEMRAAVAEQDMARLRPGMPANVRPTGSTTDYRGSVWLLDPVIDMASRQGIARIALPYSPGLRVGAFASATVAVGEASRPVLPQSAVQVDDKGSYVYVVDAQDRIVRRTIVVGTVGDQGVSVARGLEGRERVVATAAAFLNPGEKIQAITATPAARQGR